MPSSEPPASGPPEETTEDAAQQTEAEQFDQLAEEEQVGLVREFLDFALENKKWWLIPIMLVLLLVAAFIFISGTAGPFIYPLF